jgi:lambda family phage portal protein
VSLFEQASRDLDRADAPPRSYPYGEGTNLHLSETVRIPMGYDAGRTTRVDPDFMPTSAGINVQNDRYLAIAVRRIRSMVMNNPFLSAARSLFIQNVVGENGVQYQPDTGDTELDRILSDAWWAACEYVDVGREISFAMSQQQTMSEVFGGGEVGIYFPYVDAWRHCEAGPAIELIDRDRLDMQFSRETRVRNEVASRVRQGVEFDAKGRRVAYHVYVENPNDAVGFGGISGFGFLADPKGTRRISAVDMTLAFIPRSLDQVRGIPWPIATVTAARMQDAVAEAEMMLRRSEAIFGLYFRGVRPSLAPDTWQSQGNKATDQYGTPIQRVEPGMMLHLPHDAEVGNIQRNAGAQNFVNIDEALARRMAAGMGIAYSSLTRDRSKENFSSGRIDSMEDRRGYRRIQAAIAHWYKPYYERVILYAFLSGRLKLTSSMRSAVLRDPRMLYRTQTIYPGWDYVNPKQEAEGDAVGLATGFETLKRVVAARGEHWEDCLAQRVREEAAWNQLRKEAGLAAKPLFGSPDGGKKDGGKKDGNTDSGADGSDGNGGDGGDGGGSDGGGDSNG